MVSIYELANLNVWHLGTRDQPGTGAPNASKPQSKISGTYQACGALLACLLAHAELAQEVFDSPGNHKVTDYLPAWQNAALANPCQIWTYFWSSTFFTWSTCLLRRTTKNTCWDLFMSLQIGLSSKMSLLQWGSASFALPSVIRL